MLTLNELAGLIPGSVLIGPGDVILSGVTDNSHSIKPDYAFVAISGRRVDGHRFIGSAIAGGATAVIAERTSNDAVGTPLLIVPNSRAALAHAAAACCGWPARSLCTIAVTGTNGKSTSVYMMRSILKAAGHLAGTLGTIEYFVGSHLLPATMTTPHPVQLQQLLASMVNARATHCVMEASSHSLDQHRVDPIDFDAAIFTNITQDHMDYHPSFEHYLASKRRLFEGLRSQAWAAINIEDPHAMDFIAACRCHVLRYGLGPEAEVRGRAIRAGLGGTLFEATTPSGSVTIDARFIGVHNLYNALGAIAACSGLGIGLDAIKTGLEEFDGVPGRLQPVDGGQNFNVFVDYAHTDDALRAVMSSLRNILTGRLIVVFGCGGDRDRFKRPRMGAVAQRFADFAILTADNSRSERTEDIIQEISEGFTDPSRYTACPDRHVAIRRAVSMAAPGDTVLIAGKGHETKQIGSGDERDFDDRQVALCWLRKRIEEEARTGIDQAPAPA